MSEQTIDVHAKNESDRGCVGSFISWTRWEEQLRAQSAINDDEQLSHVIVSEGGIQFYRKDK